VKQLLLGYDDIVGTWVSNRTGGSWHKGQGTAVGLLNQSGLLIAGVIFDSWNGKSLCMHVAAEPGARWLNREFLWFCFAYPFDQLKVSKVLGPVGAGNLTARKFDEHLGFVLEATLKDAHPDGDLLVYSMTREQCRWLNRPLKKVAHGKAESTAAA